MEIVLMMGLCCVVTFFLGYLFGVERGERKAVKKASVPDYDICNPINGYAVVSKEVEIGIDGTEYRRMVPVTDWED